MSIVVAPGNIFDCHAEAIVNPVNCVGSMGAGLAREFARRFPAMLPGYRDACARGDLQPGSLFVYTTPDGRHVVNLATKDHWRDASTLSAIRIGARALRSFIDEGFGRPIKSIAVPALGCGLGGLAWADVRPICEQWLGDAAAGVWLIEPRA